jgi:hypothetical protein
VLAGGYMAGDRNVRFVGQDEAGRRIALHQPPQRLGIGRAAETRRCGPSSKTSPKRAIARGSVSGPRGATPNANYRPSPRLRWKLQSIPPPGVNLPDTC